VDASEKARLRTTQHVLRFLPQYKALMGDHAHYDVLVALETDTVGWAVAQVRDMGGQAHLLVAEGSSIRVLELDADSPTSVLDSEETEIHEDSQLGMLLTLMRSRRSGGVSFTLIQRHASMRLLEDSLA
jgi:hypothetical protein